MSAAEREIREFDDVVLGGSPVSPLVQPGQIDPHAWHYFYSAGERNLTVRAKECGYSSIPPGYLVPLKPFPIRVPNDTVESLFDENAPKDMALTVEPRDAADGLMTRYQHRGGRILFPLTGMEGADGLKRATRIFTAVHPNNACVRNPKILTRTCVFCRLDDLRSEKSLDRIQAARLSEKASIPYGIDGEGELRVISELEAAIIIHELVKSANEEMFIHMVDVLQQSDADVKAGRMGPGKKKFDKRDEWYLLMTHMTADAIMVGESSVSNEAASVGDIVSQTLKAVRDNGAPGAPVDVNALLAKQAEDHKKEMADLEKRLLARIGKADKKTD